MKNYFTVLEQNEKWETEMSCLNKLYNLIQDKEIISKSGCYYPRLKDTKKRGRVAFIELYREICIDGKEFKMCIEDFEFFACRHKDWKIHIQPTDKEGHMNTEFVLETIKLNYINNFEYLQTPELPPVTIEEKETDNISAIKNLTENLEMKGKEIIKVIQYFLEELKLS